MYTYFNINFFLYLKLNVIHITLLHIEIHDFTHTLIHSTELLVAFPFFQFVASFSDSKKSGSHYLQYICLLALLGLLAQACLMAF